MTTVNPFAAIGAARSNYCRFDGARLIREPDQEPPTAMTAFVHDSVLALTLNPQFTCAGAKAATRQRSYRFGLYEELGARESVAALAHDLFMFVTEAPDIEGDFTTMIASFEQPAAAGEEAFERKLWRTLQQLHDLDAAHHRWAPDVSSDPADPGFSFSFANTAFFIVGLHASSSRATRRLAWPTLVFNLHSQFEALKHEGRYDRFRHVIRDAERRLQGNVNPMLADYGERSEAVQYSGRHVSSGWRCPFAARLPKPPKAT
jgi:uncharacterized protein